MNKVKLSVCMIVKNEADKIQKCLDSVKHIADEIVVVDNGSTDRTVDILKINNCIVIDGSNYYVDEGRQLYLQRAVGDWILIIDADERLDFLTSKDLKNTLMSLDNDVYGVQLRNIQYVGEGKWADVNALRIIRNNSGICYNNTPIHSTLGPSITRQNKKIIQVNTMLHHLDILYTNRTKFKRDKYRNALIQQLNDHFKNEDIDTYYLDKAFLGLEYAAIEDYQEAYSIFETCIASQTRFKSFAKAFLGQCNILNREFTLLDELVKSADKEDIALFKETEIYGNYLYYHDKEACLRYYLKEVEHHPEKISNFINLAFLLKENVPDKAIYYLKEAWNKNEFLSYDFIYSVGEKPNLFYQQNNFLYEIVNVKELFQWAQLI